MKNADFAAVEFRMLNGFITRSAVQALSEGFKAQGVAMGHLQFAVLQMASRRPQGVTDLSRKLGLAPSTLIPTVDSLEERNLVVRERDTNDRRRVLIEVTEAGVDVLNTLMTVHEDDPLHIAIEQLGEDRVAVLLDTLRDLIRLLPDGSEMLHRIETRLNIYSQQVARASEEA